MEDVREHSLLFLGTLVTFDLITLDKAIALMCTMDDLSAKKIKQFEAGESIGGRSILEHAMEIEKAAHKHKHMMENTTCDELP